MDLRSLFSKPRAKVGIELSEQELYLAVRDVVGALRQVKVLNRDEAGDERAWSERVRDWAEKHHLLNSTCNVVLAAEHYQLLLVEAPDVPDEEMREAVKWRIKELIAIPVEDAVIDVFALPADASRAGKKMVYVVVAERSRVLDIIAMVQASGLRLNAIDTEVLALRNLLIGSEETRAIAVVRLRQGSGEVSIFRDANLYLSRHFQLAYNAGLLDDIPADALALEVQRSFDYFERQMGQAPPSILYLCGEGVAPEKLSDELRRSFTCPAEILEVPMLRDDEGESGLYQLCLGAIGATLREEAS